MLLNVFKVELKASKEKVVEGVQLELGSGLYSGGHVIKLQEVVGSSTGDVGLSSARGGVKLQKRVFEGVIELHDGRLVTTAIAVIWSAKYRHNIPLVAPVVALHDELMCTRHQRESVGVVERL